MNKIQESNDFRLSRMQEELNLSMFILLFYAVILFIMILAIVADRVLFNIFFDAAIMIVMMIAVPLKSSKIGKIKSRMESEKYNFEHMSDNPL